MTEADVGVRETSVWIAINGTRRVALSCSPHERDALALGHLVAEGWVRDTDEVLALELADGPSGATGVEARVPPAALDAALRAREHRLHHGCGLRHILDCDDAPSSPDTADADSHPAAAVVLPAANFAMLFRALFAVADAASPEGGIHAAALSDGVSLRYTATDVARHCAVDRVLGHALRARAEPPRLGLLLTSRVSGAIAWKCVNARVAWIASRSVATSLARELAAARGIALIERAARRGHATGDEQSADPEAGA
jgi:FdhD protein